MSPRKHPAAALPVPHASPAAALVTGVTLVAGCDDGFAENGGQTAAQVGAAFAEVYAVDFPDLHIYSNHKELLAAEGPLDILTVGVSDHRHAEIVIDAANAGVRAIFCEKPLATTVEDTDRMLEACERNGNLNLTTLPEISSRVG